MSSLRKPIRNSLALRRSGVAPRRDAAPYRTAVTQRRSVAFQAAMPPFLEAFFFPGFPSHSTMEVLRGIGLCAYLCVSASLR